MLEKLFASVLQKLASDFKLTLTTPFKYPERSAKSNGRSFGDPLRFFVCDRKIDPAPLRWALITRPMSNV